VLGSHKITVADVNEFGDFANCVVFVAIDIPVDIGNAPAIYD